MIAKLNRKIRVPSVTEQLLQGAGSVEMLFAKFIQSNVKTARTRCAISMLILGARVSAMKSRGAILLDLLQRPSSDVVGAA